MNLDWSPKNLYRLKTIALLILVSGFALLTACDNKGKDPVLFGDQRNALKKARDVQATLDKATNKRKKAME